MPSSHRIVIFLLFAAILCGAGGVLQSAEASALAQANGGMQAYCPKNGEYGSLFARVVICLENTVIQATQDFMNAFYPAVSQTVIWVMTLAIILFGVMMAVGAIERPARDAMFFLLKFGGVAYFMDDALNIYLQFVDILMGTLTAVADATIFGSNLRCPSLGGGGATTLPMWQRADCIFDAMVGLSSDAVTSGGSQEGLSRGMMAFFYYNLQSGALGILIGLVGLYIAFNLVLALLRASYSYLLALMTLSLLFVIGALFVPLLLFRNTYSYFDRWMKSTLAMILQPLILFAYLNILLTAFDVMLYSGPNSLVNVISGGSAGGGGGGFNVHQYAEQNLYSENFQGFTHDIDQKVLTTSTPEQNDGTLGNVEFTDIVPDYNDLAQISIDLPYRTVDYTQIPGGAAALAGATLMVGLASYILLTFMAEVPRMAHDLGGGVHETPNIIAGSKDSKITLPLSSQMSGFTKSLGGGIQQQLGSLVGRRG